MYKIISLWFRILVNIFKSNSQSNDFPKPLGVRMICLLQCLPMVLLSSHVSSNWNEINIDDLFCYLLLDNIYWDKNVTYKSQLILTFLTRTSGNIPRRRNEFISFLCVLQLAPSRHKTLLGKTMGWIAIAKVFTFRVFLAEFTASNRARNIAECLIITIRPVLIFDQNTLGICDFK